MAEDITDAISTIAPELDDLKAEIKDRSLNKEELEDRLVPILRKLENRLPEYGETDVLILKSPSNKPDYIDRYPGQKWAHAILAWSLIPRDALLEIEPVYELLNRDPNARVSVFLSAVLGNKTAQQIIYSYYRTVEQGRPYYNSRALAQSFAASAGDPISFNIDDPRSIFEFATKKYRSISEDLISLAAEKEYIPAIRYKIKNSDMSDQEKREKFGQLYEDTRDEVALLHYIDLLENRSEAERLRRELRESGVGTKSPERNHTDVEREAGYFRILI